MQNCENILKISKFSRKCQNFPENVKILKISQCFFKISIFIFPPPENAFSKLEALANRVVLSVPTRHYTSSSAAIPLRFAASSLKSLQQQFRLLSNRHTVKIDNTWKPPNIVRRKRAQILAGQVSGWKIFMS